LLIILDSEYLEKVFNSRSKRPAEEKPDDVSKPRESSNPEIDNNSTAKTIRAKGLARKMQGDDAKSASTNATQP
jgi:hypothetical protein